MPLNLLSTALRSRRWLAVSFLAVGLIATVGAVQPSHAQTTTLGEQKDAPLDGLDNSSETGVLGTRSDQLNPFDLIHNSNFNGRSLQDFNEGSRKNLNDAAAEFFRKRQQLMQQQQNPGTSQDEALPPSQ